jgi:hypothetical protein
MIHALKDLETFLYSWPVPEHAQDDIGKRDHFMPAQAPDPGIPVKPLHFAANIAARNRITSACAW